jgi:uncharacterized protein
VDGIPWPSLAQICARTPYRILFVSLSGAHLYGFASRDSDFDLRGAYVLTMNDYLLRMRREFGDG